MAIADLLNDKGYDYIPPTSPYMPTTINGPNPLGPMRSPEDIAQAAGRSANGYNLTPQAPRYQGGGVNTAKWMDPTHTTDKYKVLRYLDQFDPQVLGRQGFLNLNPQQRQGLEALGWRIVDEDKIFNQQFGEIDALHGDRTQYGWRPTGVGNVASGKAGKAGAGGGLSGPQTAGGYQVGGKAGMPGSQFTDPLTRQYEEMLKQQTLLYQQQQAQMAAEAQRKQAVRQQTDESVKRLLEFVNQRIGTLQQPAYTGREQEVLRTQYLDPLERDRQATRSRALDNIGSRGFDPSSGIAQDLLNQVDQGYDTQRAQAQGDIAYRQIQEERSRQQEAQELLQYAAGVPEAAARGDLSFLSYMNQLQNEPGQQALATSAMLADLPVQRTLLGAQVLGLGGQPQSGVNGALALLQNAQQNRLINQQGSADFWRNLGYSFL